MEVSFLCAKISFCLQRHEVSKGDSKMSLGDMGYGLCKREEQEERLWEI